MPSVFETLKLNRKCICVNAAIVDCEVEFNNNSGYTEMLSGINKYYCKDHIERIAKEGGTSKSIKVPTVRLDTLFKKHGINRIDYLSIDVEGGEYAVIKSIDFDKVDIHVIGFEDNYPEKSVIIMSYLVGKGYIYDSRTGGIFLWLKHLYKIKIEIIL